MSSMLLFCTLFALVAADQHLWSEFKQKHSKNYSREAEPLRYKIFQDNLRKIEEHNAKYQQGLVSYYLAVNQFSDLTPREFKANFLSTFSVNRTFEVLHKPVKDTPQSIDWREHGYVTEVKNQGNCGSCWSFSATGTLEGAYARKYGTLVSLSEQSIMDCCIENYGYRGNGCFGGVVQSALDFVRDHGITTEAENPYVSHVKTCTDHPVVFQISGYTGIGWGDEANLKNAVGTVGPVSVALNADLWQSYGGGIFADTSCSNVVDHGVLIVGYGQENGVEYWIVKNSWGGGWGENGYVRMKIGSNLCGLANQPCYPNL